MQLSQSVLFLVAGSILETNMYKPPPVPEPGKAFMPNNYDSFGDGIWQIIRSILFSVRPDIREACCIGAALLAVVVLISLIQLSSDRVSTTADLVGTISISGLTLYHTHSLINLSVRIIQELNEYGKLLFPVMAAAMAAHGSISSSSALYIGTNVFTAILCQILTEMIIPGVYFYLSAAVAYSALGEDSLKKIKEQIQKFVTWILKSLLTIFFSYMSITGAVSGAADAAALKVTKATISTVVPVIGAKLADASEAILLGASLAKNAAGIYGIYAILAVFGAPFIRIGCHYIVLKSTCFLCSLYRADKAAGLIQDYASGMGILMAAAGSVSMLQLISLICFMKG